MVDTSLPIQADDMLHNSHDKRRLYKRNQADGAEVTNRIDQTLPNFARDKTIKRAEGV